MVEDSKLGNVFIGPTNLNLNGFVGARAEQSSTFLAASPPSSPVSLPPSLAKQVQFRFSSNGKIAVGGVRVQATEATYHLLSASRHANNGPIQLGIVASGRHDA